MPDGGRRSRDDDSVSAPTVVNRMGDLSAKPVVVLVDDEDASRQALAREMEDRYGAHYRIRSSASQEEALAALQQLRAPTCRWSWLTSGCPAGPARNSSRVCVSCLQPPGAGC